MSLLTKEQREWVAAYEREQGAMVNEAVARIGATITKGDGGWWESAEFAISKHALLISIKDGIEIDMQITREGALALRDLIRMTMGDK